MAEGRAEAEAGLGILVATADVVERLYSGFMDPHLAVLARLGTDPARTLFVAGSPADVPAPAGAGMPVFWHNRAGLPPVAGPARPFLVADSLSPLPGLLDAGGS